MQLLLLLLAGPSTSRGIIAGGEHARRLLGICVISCCRSLVSGFSWRASEQCWDEEGAIKAAEAALALACFDVTLKLAADGGGPGPSSSQNPNLLGP